jgi:hypothetical protein
MDAPPPAAPVLAHIPIAAADCRDAISKHPPLLQLFACMHALPNRATGDGCMPRPVPSCT